MNILFINTSKSWGGNEKWTSLAAHQLAREHNVFLAYRSRNLGQRFTVEKKQFSFLNRLDILTLYRIVRFIKKKNINVIVSTNRKYYLLGAIASRLAKCRHFVRLGIVWDVPDNVLNRVLFSRLVHGIIVNAVPIQTRLVRTVFIREEQVHLIYNGLDLDKLDQGWKNASDKPFAFTIATSGELTPRKGHKEVIEGFARFVEKHGAAEAGLVIMGRGRQKKELEDLAADLDIADQVLFTGFLDNPYPLLASSDLYVTLSRNEGISNSLLEAMYLKVPVVSSSAGGAGEIIKDGSNGFMVWHVSGEALADIIYQVYSTDKEKRVALAMAGRKTVIEMFSMEQMTRSLERILADQQNNQTAKD